MREGKAGSTEKSTSQDPAYPAASLWICQREKQLLTVL